MTIWRTEVFKNISYPKMLVKYIYFIVLFISKSNDPKILLVQKSIWWFFAFPFFTPYGLHWISKISFINELYSLFYRYDFFINYFYTKLASLPLEIYQFLSWNIRFTHVSIFCYFLYYCAFWQRNMIYRRFSLGSRPISNFHIIFHKR